MSARRIVIWRHGRTAWNAERRFQGQTDVPLDATGFAQAERAAAALVAVSPVRIISSDLARARETAQALASRVDLEVHLDRDLRETFAGSWEGLSRVELEEQFGDELARWASGSDVRPGGGETRVEVSTRMVAAIDRALEHVGPRQTLVVATHGGAARAAIGAMIGLPAEYWAGLGVLTNCAWSVLQENVTEYGPGWRLQEYNAGSLPETALADDR